MLLVAAALFRLELQWQNRFQEKHIESLLFISEKKCQMGTLASSLEADEK
jgi:hypothetical protein|tara:strand:+ start:422 stop:571 length:150 start_codon:yes stop_codon:yes gene_type:complete